MTPDPIIRPGPGEPQNSDVGDQERWLCAVCRVATVQTIVRSWWVDYALRHDWKERDAYALLQCDGCKSVSLMHRRLTPDTETTYCDEDGEFPVQPDATVLPARCELTATLKLGLCSDELSRLPWPVIDVWRETLSALDHNLPRLAAVGLRAVIEAIGVSGRVSPTNGARTPSASRIIAELETLRFIRPGEARHFRKLVDTGDFAAHKHELETHSDVLSRENLAECVTTLDHVLFSLYVLGT